MTGPDSQVEAPILDGVTLRVFGIGGGNVRVEIHHTAGESDELLYADEYGKGFYKNRTSRGEIKNQVADELADTPLDAEKWEQAWGEFCSKQISQRDEALAEIVPPNVRDIANGTEQVKVLSSGDSAAWRITLTWNGKSREIELTHEDMATGGVAALRSQMYAKFYDSPDIEQEDFGALRDYWIEIQEETAAEYMTETDRGVESFMRKLQERVRGVDDPEQLANAPASAWVDPQNEYGLRTNGHVDDGEGIVWVRSDLVSEILDELSLDMSVGKLATELQERKYVVRSTAELQPKGKPTKRRYWFFSNADDALNIEVYETGNKDSDAPGGVEA